MLYGPLRAILTTIRAIPHLEVPKEKCYGSTSDRYRRQAVHCCGWIIRILFNRRSRNLTADEASSVVDCLTPSRLDVFVICDDSALWFGCDGNLNVSTLFEPHIIAIVVG